MGIAKNLSDVEVREILFSLKGKYKVSLRVMLVIGCVTGFRVRELLSLKIKDVVTIDGLVKKYINVKASQMKGRKHSRSIRLPENVQILIAEYINQYLRPRLGHGRDFYLFPRCSDVNQPMPYKRVYRALKAAAIRAGLDERGISTHSMRKTWVVNFLRNTQSQNPYDTLQVAGNWKSRDAMMHYIPMSDEISEVDKTQERIGEQYQYETGILFG